MAANTTAEVPTFKLVLVGDGGTGMLTTTCSFSFKFFFFSSSSFYVVRVLKKNFDLFSDSLDDHSWGLNENDGLHIYAARLYYVGRCDNTTKNNR